MTTMTTAARPTTSSRFRAGLALSAFLGLGNIATIFIPTPDPSSGQESAPPIVLVVSVVFGLVNIACAAVAWRSGNRAAVRVNAAVLIILALLSLPPFFVDIDAWIKVLAAVSVILTVVALVLTLRREPAPYVVTD